MSTLQEIEAAIPALPPEDLAALRTWLDEFQESQLELTDAVTAELAEARRDIQAGRHRTRQPS